MTGRCLCVSFTRPEQIKIASQIAQSVMLDNGAFSAWRSGKPTDWPGYYSWCEEWLSAPTTWAVIPDVIVGDETVQDGLLAQWPFSHRGVPVWHMHESIDRLKRLTESWPRVCIGSSGQYAAILTDRWSARMDLAWNAIAKNSVPWIHMLRGMQLVEHRWPFSSVDSTDVARNHARPRNNPRTMADRWDSKQAPSKWTPAAVQLTIEGL